MVYAVFTPERTMNGTKIVPRLITDDLESARRFAVDTRKRLEAKGFTSWAKSVKIRSPKTPDAYCDLAAQVAEYGHQLDIASNGNSFVAQSLLDWANILRVRADELANPEAYAD